MHNNEQLINNLTERKHRAQKELVQLGNDVATIEALRDVHLRICIDKNSRRDVLRQELEALDKQISDVNK